MTDDDSITSSDDSDDDAGYSHLNSRTAKSNVRNPTSAYSSLENFERDPSIALLSMSINTGLARFSEIPLLFKESTSVDSNDRETLKVIDSLRHSIDSNLPDKERGEIYEKFKNKIDMKSDLIACACCGLRAFQMGEVNYKYLRVKEMKSLLLNEDQVLKFKAIPRQYQAAISVYTSNDGNYYYLHPELVQHIEENHETKEKAALCECFFGK